MPVQNKDLGNYLKLPAIYQPEKDLSTIELPLQDVLVNLVPGFSRRGPYNCPILVKNANEFENIFGAIDKNLENKGSYFHRMVEDMLTVGPVYALNLLKTDSSRDILEFESFSASSQYNNATKDTSPYERFFNRQDFWYRDRESFMDIVIDKYSTNPTINPNPEHNLLNFTNMGDKEITLFIYKSDTEDFDVTAEQWYGSADKVPLYIFPEDLISDYIVTILVVNGNFSNYKSLTTDNYWNKYFNSKGLIKSKISDFLNDSLVNVIDYYDVSLIPDFRDVNGVDMYIESVVNSYTDKTGLFCAYNKEFLLESDFYKGSIDVIGQTLVNSTKKTVDFLSYKGTISETMIFEEKLLDSLNSPTNSFGNYGSDLSVPMVGGYNQRTANYTNLYTNISPTSSTGETYSYNIYNISGDTITLDILTGITQNFWHDTGNTFGYWGWTWNDAYNWNDWTTGTTTNYEVGDEIYFNQSFDGISKTKKYYVIWVGGNQIKISETLNGQPFVISSSGSTSNISIYSLKTTFQNSLDYVLYDTVYTLESDKMYGENFNISNPSDIYSRYDVLYLNSDNTKVHCVKGNQNYGLNPIKPDFKLNTSENIILGYFKHIYSGGTITSSYTGVTTDAGNSYIPLLVANSDVYGVSGSTTSNNYLDIYFLGTKLPIDYTNYNQLRKTRIFNDISNAILLNKGVIININNGDKYSIISPTIFTPTLTTDGQIRIYFDLSTNPFDYFRADGGFLIYYIDKEFTMDPINAINKLITTIHPIEYYSGSGTGIVAKWSELYLAYYNGYINNGDYFWVDNDSGSTSSKVYLKFSMDANDNLTIEFLDEYDNPKNIYFWSAQYNSELIIYSDISNWKQTVDIENTSYITDFQNTTSIYVDKNRYPEITRGMYLEAYYDTTYYDDPTGEGYLLGMYPRKLVRIIDIQNDIVNTDYKILYTDGPIKISSNYQTTSYSTLDNYFNEYNGLSLRPFVVHTDSIPNNTDSRQQEILSVLDKDTNLAKGLSNKNRISWRYLVDSFGLGLTANSKQEFVDLCGEKINCFGFINMPSVRQLKTSLNPSFINTDRTLNTEYLKKGGNPNLNPSFLYSFGNGVGRSTVGYFFPYVKDVNDKSKFIPPSSKVAKAYMNKFVTSAGGVYPWTIVAGAVMGNLPDVYEIEARFTNDDLINLNKMGANTINYTLKSATLNENIYYINTENMAQVFPYSSLSIIHCREVLIELENKLYDMLLNYQWKFNTSDIRTEIVQKADYICEYFLNNSALYNFQNIMDESNNTDYIIDLQMGVLDTYVELIKGMGTIVNNITILKKGTLNSKGFITTNKTI